jgi:hypothetical protein
MFSNGFEPWHILVLMGFPLIVGGVAFAVIKATSSRSGRTVAYGDTGDASPMASQGTNGLAIASLVLGILWLTWIGSILALIFGYIARSQVRRRGQGGDGLALAGIVLGWVGVATLVLLVVFGLAVSTSGGTNVVVIHH